MQFNRNLGSNAAKSIFIAILMISMSLSMGLMGDNNLPWSTESAGNNLDESSKTLQTSGTPPSISYPVTTLDLERDLAIAPVTPVNSGGGFDQEVISNALAGFIYSDVVVDSLNKIHIFYHMQSSSDESNTLKYITKDQTNQWTSLDLDNPAGHLPRAYVDANDVLHVAYVDRINNELKYATCSSLCYTSASQWSTVVVDSVTEVGDFTDIVVDTSGNIHIAYQDETNDDLRYATCSSGCTSTLSWSTVRVDDTLLKTDQRSMTFSIDVDSAGDIHIVYVSDLASEVAEYATCSNSCLVDASWTSSVAIDTNDEVYHVDLVIDSGDALHLAVYDFEFRDLEYFTCINACSGATWSSPVVVESISDQGAYASINVDSENKLYISHQYYQGFDWDLSLSQCVSACQTASSWSTITLQTQGVFDGNFIGSALNLADDSLHIIHSDVNGHFLYLDLNSTGYSVTPDLPSGLGLGLLDGEIFGTPTVSTPAANYIITATNSHGSDTVSMTIAVATLPSISYPITSANLAQNAAMTPLIPIIAQGTDAPTGCVVSSGNLPPGLSIDNSCVISGTPTSVTSEVFTVTPSTAAGNGAP
ncbi:MAG: Ig domain-containing protein, partial [Candidatus Thermoplasmatota archaeon]|nr:Ig domain-containing protein [Candidatus Thermoplasmatota archaeon]